MLVRMLLTDISYPFPIRWGVPPKTLQCTMLPSSTGDPSLLVTGTLSCNGPPKASRRR